MIDIETIKRNQNPIDRMTVRQLLRHVDRKNPEVRALAWYLERYVYEGKG